MGLTKHPDKPKGECVMEFRDKPMQNLIRIKEKKLQAIQEAAAQAVKDAYEDEPHADAQVAMLIANQAADNDNQVSVEQVRQQLAEEYPLAAVPFDYTAVYHAADRDMYRNKRKNR